jgi:Transglycosylase
MSKLRRCHLAWLAAIVALGFLALAFAFGIAWLTAPSTADLGARVRARERQMSARPVRLSQVAPVMREAVVATEDERFYRHDGIDAIGILRAVPYDLSHFSLAEGASTITEQLAKLIYLGGNDHSPWRKLQDAAIALHIEASYSKQRILDDYLNTVYFGAGGEGIAMASRRYFAVSPARLDLAQATLLAGLIQDPSGDQPYTDPTGARGRQADALRSMVRNGFVTEREARHALEAPLRLAHGPPLPPLRGVSLEPGPPFYWGELALGGALLALGVAGLVALGRVHPRLRWPARISSRVGMGLAVGVGALLVLGSFRGV